MDARDNPELLTHWKDDMGLTTLATTKILSRYGRTVTLFVLPPRQSTVWTAPGVAGGDSQERQGVHHPMTFKLPSLGRQFAASKALWQERWVRDPLIRD